MAWVVDTCLLIDVAQADVSFGIPSARLLDDRRGEGLVICPISYVELAPVFKADRNVQNEFLFDLSVVWPQSWTTADSEEAFHAWNRYVSARHAAKIPKRPLADVLIGAFASRFDGLLTRNASDFSNVFPNLKILVP
jgi:hypothetical protein